MAQQGFIFERYGSWFVKYRINSNIDGEVVRKLKCVFLAKKGDCYRKKSDLRELAQEKLEADRAADKCPRSSDSFVTYAESVYLPMVARTMKPSTYAGYDSYWRRYIKPQVKGKTLRDFTVAVVSTVLTDIADMHSRSDDPKIRPLNTDSVTKIRSILSGIFTYAMAKGNFPGKSASDNPASRALIPESATEPKETVAASRDDLLAILAHLNSEGLTLERAAVALVAHTGVRPGEARGLRWEEWNRAKDEIQIVRSVWHAIEGSPKTPQSIRFVAVTPELRTILLALWNKRGSPLKGYILAHADGGRVNLDNMTKRVIAPALSRCAVCQETKSAKHKDHDFVRDESLPRWTGWYSLRRFHGTQVRDESGSADTASRALGNSKEVFNEHYNKPKHVLSDVRKAVNSSMSGLTA